MLIGLLVAVSLLLLRAGHSKEFPYDFLGFYSPGRLLNEYPARQLYDFALQERVFRGIRPSEPFLTLPYVHAPFEALVFAQFARLPYSIAYFAWLACGAVGYAVTLHFLLGRFGPRGRGERKTAWLLSLSFLPFMLESLIGGNVAVIAFVALSAAVILDDIGYPFLAGVALSLCLNKPSLLILVLPMLLVSGRIRTLGGFACGGAVLVLASSLVLGWEVWWRFVEALFTWARATRAAPGLFKDWKYVDLNAFFRMLPGGRSWGARLLMSGIALWAMVRLVQAWLPKNGDSEEVRRLRWACAIVWTLVLNAYVPIYDCTLLVLAGFVTVGTLRDPVSDSVPPPLRSLVGLCYVTPWFTQHVARFTGVQLYTLVLIYAGVWLLSEVKRQRETRAAGKTGQPLAFPLG